MAVRLGFCSSKGGVSKTTLSCLLASALHYGYEDIRVAIIDSDPQQSLSSARVKEAEAVLSNDTGIKKFLDSLKKSKKSNIYDIISVPLNTNNVPAFLDKVDNDYDYIIVDTPSGMHIDGLEAIYKSLDFIFIPYNTTDYVITSTKSFLNYAIENVFLAKGSNVRALALINVNYPVNISSPSVQSFQEWNKYFADNFKVPVLKNNLKESDFFKIITKPSDIESASHKLGLSKSETSSAMSEAVKISIENSNIKRFVNTLSPFPDIPSFQKISPYGLINELLDFIKQNI